MSATDESVLIRRLLTITRLAIVGLSDDPRRPSRMVTRYLLNHGKEIVPVNPNYETVLDLPCYPSLQAIPETPELAVVFRAAEHAPSVVRDAVAAGVHSLWFQQGIINRAARELARDYGLDYIEDRCIKVELMMRKR